MEDRKPEQGFDNGLAGISEKSREALQSETWQAARRVMKPEIQHFTETPEIQETGEAGTGSEKPVRESAIEKLERELKDAKDGTFAGPVIGYLLKRCEEDNGLAQDVVQKHKTWKKCFDYIYAQARKQAEGNCTAVRDEVVYEWAEDYFHKDDKAEEEQKAKKEAEDKARREKEAAKKKASGTGKGISRNNKNTELKTEEQKKEPPKPRKSERDVEGQIDMFSLMGM